jgi:hypothetical protein
LFYLAQAAALAAVATKFTATSHHHPPSTSSQLGRDIDERDRQSSTTMRGDIDERPSDVYNRAATPATNLGLLQPSANLHSPTSSSSISLSVSDEHLKSKNMQDIFRTPRPTSVEILPTTLSSNTSVGPSFDFISMLEQLKQPRQIQSTYVVQLLFSRYDRLRSCMTHCYLLHFSDDSLEIRSSSNPSCAYILRPVLVAFRPYTLPDRSTSPDPRLPKYIEKMTQWSERARLERYKTPLPLTNNYSAPLRAQQQQLPINDSMLSRDPRLLRNTMSSSSKIGMPILPTPTTFGRPNDNVL